MVDKKYEIGQELKALYLTTSWDRSADVKVVGYGQLTTLEALELQESGSAVKEGDVYYNCLSEEDDAERVIPFFEHQLRLPEGPYIP